MGTAATVLMDAIEVFLGLMLLSLLVIGAAVGLDDLGRRRQAAKARKARGLLDVAMAKSIGNRLIFDNPTAMTVADRMNYGS